MFERFTDRARATVVLAQEEARRLQHNYIGTEHVLLALLRQGEGVAARVLGKMGVTVSQVQAEIEKIIGRGDRAPSGHIPFTPRAKKVLELALREALHLKHNYIGTEHILLGLLREGEGVAAQVLVNRGADLQKLRTATLAELSSGGGPERVAPTEGPPRTPAAEQAVATAQQLAGTAPLGSHHLLEALARSENSLASRVLAAVGVDPETLAAKIDELGLEGTSDLTPEQEAAGQMEVRLAGEELHIVLRDETAVGLGRTVTEKLNGPLRGTDPFAGPLIGLRDAVLRCLEEVRTRLDPPPAAPDEPETTNLITTVIHRAMRSRLQRRNRPRSADLEADDDG